MNKDLRIVQLIDSLEAGGAERMAVNYANTLSDVIGYSALVTTRKEGALKEQLSDQVGYLFLRKKDKLDLGAVLRLRTFIKQHQINLIHAHGTSFFTAVLLKMTYPKVKIIWHDHHGNRVNKKGGTNLLLKRVSFLFEGVLTVNEELELWAKSNLASKKIRYFPNFVTSKKSEVVAETLLKGENGKRIVFLANLKNPKNHLKVIQAFATSEAIVLNWSLHLIGKDYYDSYSEELKKNIETYDLDSQIFIYDSCNDVEAILNQCTIGILGSTYEGFPVTLLEYGKANLAVLCTNVGYCSSIISDSESGLLFNPNSLTEINDKINVMIESESTRKFYAKALNQKVLKNYSNDVVMQQYLEWLKEF